MVGQKGHYPEPFVLTEDLDIGANPSAEEADEGVEDGAQTVLDVVHSFRLSETSFDKKSYLSHLKSKHTRAGEFDFNVLIAV